MGHGDTIDLEKLYILSKELGVSVEEIKNFNEETGLGSNNYFHAPSNFQDNAGAIVNHINPIDKIVEMAEKQESLYERLLGTMSK